ncbi:hypothetical protein B0H13DRAFT_1856818 [Mycena leptocephala]|nr:hypothetical protein B0H13DRAFT_1856818 [Mycena leptocephala]
MSSPHSQDISRWLPNDILLDIMEISSKSDQASLCLVSKLFHALCLPILNRTVHLNYCASSIAFCSALIADPTRAEAVRSLTVVEFSSPWDRPARKRRSEVLMAALELMLMLEHLSIRYDILADEHAVALLEHRTFPRLLTCAISPPISYSRVNKIGDLLAAFWARHPTLTGIHFFSTIGASPSVRMDLPNLQCYDGPADVMRSIVCGGLKEARIEWDPFKVDNDILTVLKSKTRPDIPFILSVIAHPTDCGQITERAAREMPQMRTLHLDPLDKVWLLDHPFRDVVAFLSRFTRLGYFGIEGRVLENRRTEADRDTMEAWTVACPTLEACCLNGFAWREVDGTWQECSLDEFRTMAGLPEAGRRDAEVLQCTVIITVTESGMPECQQISETLGMTAGWNVCVPDPFPPRGLAVTEDTIAERNELSEFVANPLKLRQYLRIPVPAHQKALTRLLLSSHTLGVEILRYAEWYRVRAPREFRFCHFCRQGVETEAHAMIACSAPALAALCHSFIQDVYELVSEWLRNWNSSEDFLRMLVQTRDFDVLQRLAKYTFEVFAEYETSSQRCLANASILDHELGAL